jgi:tetratricopeptide (TPR) repeat protein
MLGDLGRHAEALETFKQALQFNPKDAFYHCAVGNELVSLGHEHAALKAFEEAERLKPDYAQPHLEAAKLLFKQGQEARAVDELRAAVKAEPDNFQTLATVAHYLAANQQTAARDGALALKLALKANKLSGQIQPMVWDTLGMAYAATGDFGHAVACAQQALKLAKAAGLKNLDDIQRRLTLYQNQQPWRETFEATNSSFGTILISHSSSDRPR